MSETTLPTLTQISGISVELPAAILVVEPPDEAPREVPLEVGTLTIGSSQDCDIAVVDPGVSRNHCTLTVEDRGVVVRDLDSKNGTYIGEVPIVEVILPVATPVRIGKTILKLRPHKAQIVSLSATANFGDAVGSSVVMRALFARLERIATTQETVMLLGESGTGKEVLAHAIHDHSPRDKGPFVIFDCSATAPNLIEAEIFGHVKGAFTGAVGNHTGLFEQAHGGTLFIDEIGELPMELQPKLLRAIESRSVRPVGSNSWRKCDVRLICATHRDLKKRVASEEFREDLFYRLAVFQVQIPPLRERAQDIPLLVEHFLSRMDPPKTIEDIPPNVVQMLKDHRWPGNVRELRNTVSRVALLPDGLDDLLDPFGQTTANEATRDHLFSLPLRDAREAVIENFERRYLTLQLKLHGGNVSKAAATVGVSRQFLHRLLDRHGLSGADFRG